MKPLLIILALILALFTPSYTQTTYPLQVIIVIDYPDHVTKDYTSGYWEYTGNTGPSPASGAIVNLPSGNYTISFNGGIFHGALQGITYWQYPDGSHQFNNPTGQPGTSYYNVGIVLDATHPGQTYTIVCDAYYGTAIVTNPDTDACITVVNGNLCFNNLTMDIRCGSSVNPLTYLFAGKMFTNWTEDGSIYVHPTPNDNPFVLTPNQNGFTVTANIVNSPYITLMSNWNLVSNSVVDINTAGGMYIGEGPTPIAQYPNLQFQYGWQRNSDSYSTVTQFTTGRGYWVKLTSGSTGSFGGNKIKYPLTINVFQGWNIIGGGSESIPVGKVFPQGGLGISKLYDYVGTPTYHEENTAMVSGKGYWVLANAAGTIVINPNASGTAPTGTTATPPPAPTSSPAAPVLSCANCVALGHPSLSWTATANGGTYMVSRATCVYGDPECEMVYHNIYSGSNTTFTDNEVTIWKKTGAQPAPEGIYYYRVRAINTVGEVSPYSNVLNIASGEILYTKIGATGEKEEIILTRIPATFGLDQNFPNGFNPTTQIKYRLSSDVHVTLVVYDVLGKEVARLVDGDETAGFKTVEFNAGNLVSGIYFYHLQAGNFSDVKKMILMK